MVPLGLQAQVVPLYPLPHPLPQRMLFPSSSGQRPWISAKVGEGPSIQARKAGRDPINVD